MPKGNSTGIATYEITLITEYCKNILNTESVRSSIISPNCMRNGLNRLLNDIDAKPMLRCSEEISPATAYKLLIARSDPLDRSNNDGY